MDSNLSQLEAERIINTLSNGVPALDQIMAYTSEVDSKLIETIKGHLDKVKRGITIARFVKGGYGSGKSHFLSIVREIALNDNYLVSYFDLRAREGFDMIERVLSKIIKNLSVNNKRTGSADETVLDYIFHKWANQVENIEKSVLNMELDATNRDFINVISLYGKIMKEIIPRQSDGFDLLEIINRWFQAEGLVANQRKKINTNNNINVRNTRETMDSLAIFFREIGYSGWVILIDEQEIIPTLMSKKKRGLSNENLKVIIDTQSRTQYMYYLFATTPQFFTDPLNGINAYPALRQRVNDVLEIQPITKKEMTEAGQNIKEVYCTAYPDFQGGQIPKQKIKDCANHIDSNFSNDTAKARIFVISYIKLLEKLRSGTPNDLMNEFKEISGLVWDVIANEEKEAYDRLQ